MTIIAPVPAVKVDDDDFSRPDTPLASQSPSQTTVSVGTADLKPSLQISAVNLPSHHQSNDLESSNPSLLFPIPSLLTKTSLTLSDLTDGCDGLEPLSHELASADVSIAPDTSFIELSSGPAARELKRRWDLQIGVGKAVRSPYAITAFVNQHGKQMFRVSRRELSAPAANAAEIEDRITQSSSPSEPSASPKGTRRSRMSLNAFPSMFKNGSISSGTRTQGPTFQVPAPRKLRKTRSNSDLMDLESASCQNTASTGRSHSRSVTGADVAPFTTVVRPEPPAHDIFSEVMEWSVPPPTPSSSHSTPSVASSRQASNEPYDHFKSYTRIAHPFGPGVTFNVPARKTMNDDVLHLPIPRHLREMQSFESGLTARQVDSPRHYGRTPSPSTIFESGPATPDIERPPSALRISSSTTSIPDLGTRVSPTPPTPPPISISTQATTLIHSPETALYSHYSTDVFDVLQTYRGLPLLDKLSLGSEQTTVKMSLSADDSAAPRDDPRFVIWGELQAERDSDDRSMSHESVTDLSVHSSSLSISKRRTSKAKAPEPPSTRTSAPGETQRVLLAATIERWIAQLTSDLNYDELLDFFLTYRTYVDSVELCRLLISRFHWALQQPSSSHDEKVRRIVRVRTFVAIRYWLLTFFTVDFLPKRELRLLVADWLNTLIRDPVTKKHSDGLGIVRKLIKVAKECKQAHTPCPPRSRPRAFSDQPKQVPPKPHVLGEQFAAATRKSIEDDEDSDLDLDFIPDEGAGSRDVSQFAHDCANAHLAVAHAGATGRTSSSIPFSSLSILQRTDHAPGPGIDPEVSFVQTIPATLPIHHNAISRAFVKTIGRLGRWKRVLNSRATARTSLGACADVSAFDLELNMSRDLLTVNGGVEQYLKMIGPPKPFVPPALPPPSAQVSSEAPAAIESTPTPSSVEIPAPAQEHLEPVLQADSVLENVARRPPDYEPSEAQAPRVASAEVGGDALREAVILAPADREDEAVSVRTTSTDSFGQPLASGGPAPMFSHLGRSQWQFDVVSIDELDLSDTSSEHHVEPPAPPGLRRPGRKLPLRRDFGFVRRSGTVSSMGIISRDSVPSNTSSLASSSSIGGLGGNVAQWQLNALVDSLSDDDEKGDVEDALKRLEGQINVQKQQEKASKVDGWVRSIRERMAVGDYNDAQSMYSEGEEDEEGSENDYGSGFDPEKSLGSDGFDDSASQHRFAVSPPPLFEPESSEDNGGSSEDVDIVHTPMPTHTAYVPQTLSPDSFSRTSDTKPPPEPAVPFEILQSRVPSRPTTADASLRTSLSRFATSPSQEARRVHRSFILNYRASTLAGHFAMIDRELFMSIKFEELVLDDWMGVKEVNVLDWAQFLKDRARWKVESRFPDKTSALAAVRGRFNLMANFTISEIVLTPPNERPLLVGKFIRIAWKSYTMCNFNALVAIVTALGSEWVTKAMRRPGWHRVGIWENRMLKDFKLFASHAEDFKYIRQVVASIVDVKPLDITSHTPSVVSGGGIDAQSGKGKAAAERPVVPSACIPFVGIYLSQLQRYGRLPDLIDPTAPDEPVGIHPETSNFDAPAHPEVFSALAPLPDSMNLEPLINVHKQRRIACVIKSLVAGQHLASRVHFDLDKKLFQRCLRLRGLSPEMLQRASDLHE